MIFQILDANYSYDSDRNPLVQLFGSTPEGKSVTCRVAGFRPYFYAGVEDGCLKRAAEDLQAMGLEVEEVERFEPIGYQNSPKKMLKITAIDPKEVRSLRERVREVPGIKAVYETDILFKNRFLIDQALGGMGWVEAPIPEWTLPGPVACVSSSNRKCANTASSAARGQCSVALYELRHRMSS